MSEIQKLHELITTALAEIQEIKKIIDAQKMDKSAKLVDTKYICNDLGISYSHFEKSFLRKMVNQGVLFQMQSNGKYYARLTDYNDFKERLVTQFQTLRKQL